MIENLQKDFNHISTYLIKNELYLSVEKTCYMPIITSHMELENVEIKAHTSDCNLLQNCKCKLIKTVSHTKYLGLDIDKNWKFYFHIESLIKKLRYSIPKLYKIRSLLTKQNKLLIYETCVTSIVRYACTIYGTTSKGLIDRIQKLLNKAAKVLFMAITAQNAQQIFLRKTK